MTDLHSVTPLRRDDRFEADPYAFSGGRNAALNYIAPIMPFLRGRRNVLDVGCGQGFLLEELKRADVPATGIDTNVWMIADLVDDGLNAIHDDGFAFLRTRCGYHNDDRDYGFDVIVISHLIEHFDADDQLQLLKNAVGCLTPHGRLVVVTPNIENPVAAANFWLDPTHIRPMPRALLRQSVQDLGLTVIGEGATWPWTRRRLLRDMRAAGHDIPVRSAREWFMITKNYARNFALFGPQLNLLRGDIWLVAEKR